MDTELLTFDCPRCRQPATAAFYGPCRACIVQLRTHGGEAREVEAVAYEPKMNVVPNQVATKD